ncbi:MAG: TonB-dependent receptor [Asticcacaulis sp.]|nr:TonB-dependent receptor [Asticcacaulis sp.]
MLIGLLSMAATAACAQDSQPPATDEATTQVIVKGEKRKATDRDVYEVDKDVQAADGTVADALNKVPGVAVDPAGNITLRGRHVEIYVDGHPSLILTGDNRSAALRAMPSRYISSIEVISTPGAQFGSQGSGGIINLVTSHGLPDSWSGTTGIRTISTGGIDSNAFLNWHTGKLTASGFLYYNHTVSDTASSQSLSPFDTTGLPLQTTDSQGVSHSVTGGPNASGNFEYEIGPDDRLRGQASFMQMRLRSGGVTRYTVYNASGLENPYTDENTGQMNMDSGTLGLGWTHYGKKPDETLRIDGILSRRGSDFSFQDQYSGGQQSFNAVQNRSETRTADFTLDYNTTVGDDQLSAGLQLTQAHETTRNSGTMAAFDSAFDYRQTLSAAYLTWQKEFGDKWTVLAGLRSETLELDTNLISSDTTGHVTDTRLNPSFFATYVMSPKARWRFSYAHRLQRPQPRDLNPYVAYINATHLSSGNPHLRPQETGAWEATYEYTDKGTSYTVRGFYNRDEHLITAASIAETDSAGNAIIRTMAVNSGTATAIGIAMNGNRRLSSKLYLNADITLQTMRVPDFGRSGSQSLTAINGSFGFGYTLSTKDNINFSFNSIGKRLTGQGYMSSFAYDNLSWSHSLTQKVQLSVYLSNILRMNKTFFVTDSNVLRSRSVTSPQSPTLSISLSRSFGGFSKP